jgi:hypothetical protein
MFNYIFPIFAFGLVITGIVFLGIQQAADLAKALAEQRSQAESELQKPLSPVPSSGGAAGKPPAP